MGLRWILTLSKKVLSSINYTSVHSFIFSIFLAGNLDEYRLRPASPNPGEQVLIDHSEVTYDNVTDEYTVRLFPLDCGSNFSLFEVMNKQVLGRNL